MKDGSRRSGRKPKKGRAADARALDVATRAGVSQSAVSRALSNSPGVSEETRKNIRRIAAELNYHPNALASGLITRRSGLVGIVVSDMSNMFLNSILEILLDRLKATGNLAVILSAGNDAEIDAAASDLGRYRVDCCFVISPHLDNTAARQYSRLGCVILLFNKNVAGMPAANSVSVDNYTAGATVADYLISKNHHDLAYLHGVEGASTDRDRYQGFIDRIAQHNFAAPLTGRGDYTYSGGVRAVRELLSATDKRPKAIFCANDMMAMAAIDTARSEFSLRVPEELAVVGFDDSPPAKWSAYSLTTMHQPVDAMLDAALELMIEHQEANATRHGDRLKPRGIVFESKLVIRESA